MGRAILFAVLISSSLRAQNEWVIQPWMLVYGTTPDVGLGWNVTGLGYTHDTARIAVATYDSTRIFYMKQPQDTIARMTLPGHPVLALGDFNGDGIDDLVVGGDVASEFSVRIFLGKQDGTFEETTFFEKHGEHPDDGFGAYLAVGRINGDQYDDLVVTAPSYPDRVDSGKVYMFAGGAEMDTIPEFSVIGWRQRRGLGFRVAVGDLDNDGYDDIIARGFDSNNPDNLQRYSFLKIFRGGETIDTSAWNYLIGTYMSFGDVACFDVNGDQIDDFLWGNIDSLETVYIHLGRTGGIDSIPNLKLKNPGVASLGEVIAPGADMNGDGHPDIVVSTGIGGGTITSGFVFVYSGGPYVDGKFDAAVGQSTDSKFGFSVSSIGDIDGDGCDDIIVGAPLYDFSTNKGFWGIFLGSSNIPVTSVTEQTTPVPETFTLFKNHPNPFNPSTVIRYDLHRRCNVVLVVYDALGKEVARLVSDVMQDAGEYSYLFDAAGLSSGVYLYRLTTIGELGERETQTQPMLLLK